MKKFEVRKKKTEEEEEFFKWKLKPKLIYSRLSVNRKEKKKKKGRHFKNFCTSSFIYSERSLKGSFDTNNAEKDILPISETKKEAGKTREKVWRRLKERERERMG